MCHGTREQASCGCAPQSRHEHTPHHHYWAGEDFAGGFGIRRPLADAAAADAFDTSKASEAAKLRVDGAQRLQQRVADALAQMHAVLEPEQRARLAYLLRTGTLVM
jgi:hypothetical protein